MLKSSLQPRSAHAVPVPICSVKNNDYNEHYFAICFLLSAIPLFAADFLISTLIFCSFLVHVKPKECTGADTGGRTSLNSL